MNTQVVYAEPVACNQISPDASVPPAYAQYVVPDYDARLRAFEANHEINPRFTRSLLDLIKYTSVLICDDSGSMNGLADPDVCNITTRWDELKKSIKIILDIHEMLDITCDVYFINRPSRLGVRCYNDIAYLFNIMPNGYTNLVNIMSQIERSYVNSDMGKQLLVHLFTDGHPTNNAGDEDIVGFTNWLINRKYATKTFYSIILCTDDEEVERAYRRLERNNIRNIDITEDYRGERRDVQRTRGKNYKFTFGDYVVKTIVGSYDNTVHQIDLPQNSCCLIL